MLALFFATPGIALAWSLNAGCANGAVSGQFDIPSSYANNLPVSVHLFDGATNIGQAGPFYDGSGSGSGGHVFNYNISAAGHSGDLVVKLFYDGAYHETGHTNPDCVAPTPTKTATATPTHTPTPTNTPEPPSPTPTNTATPTSTATTPPNDPTSTPIATATTPITVTTPTTPTTPTTNSLLPASTPAQLVTQVAGVSVQRPTVVEVKALPRTGDGGSRVAHPELALFGIVIALGAALILGRTRAGRAR